MKVKDNLFTLGFFSLDDAIAILNTQGIEHKVHLSFVALIIKEAQKTNNSAALALAEEIKSKQPAYAQLAALAEAPLILPQLAKPKTKIQQVVNPPYRSFWLHPNTHAPLTCGTLGAVTAIAATAILSQAAKVNLSQQASFALYAIIGVGGSTFLVSSVALALLYNEKYKSPQIPNNAMAI
jgi:hypothetical protein